MFPSMTGRSSAEANIDIAVDEQPLCRGERSTAKSSLADDGAKRMVAWHARIRPEAAWDRPNRAWLPDSFMDIIL